ncbi:coilin [Musca autumnalis]|uniref:coilin n=1 Tax=Musca autumnalis TaxID=221902 RepID=UPI003CED878B
MSKFSIKIDLSTFFEDERKMALLMVDTAMWTHVKCLQKRVETLFEVDCVRFLNEGCFLHPNEPIEILKFCQELKAFVPKESLEKRKRKRSTKHKENQEETTSERDEKEDVPDETINNSLNCADAAGESKKKRKYRSLGDFNTSTPNNCSKRLKNCVALHATIREDDKRVNKSSEITSTSNEQMPPPPTTTMVSSKSSKKSKKSKLHSNVIAENNETINDADTKVSNGDTTITNQVSHNGTNKTIVNSYMEDDQIEKVSYDKHEKSEVRRRKPKESKSISETSIDKSSPPTRHSYLPSSTFISNSGKSGKANKSIKNPFKEQPTNSKHLHFNESGEITTTTNTTNAPETETKSPPINIIFRCQTDNLDTKTPRILHIKRDNNKDCISSKKPIIEIQENILLKPLEVLNNSEGQNKNSTEENKTTTSLIGPQVNDETYTDNNNTQEEDESLADSINNTTIRKSNNAKTAENSHRTSNLNEITTTVNGDRSNKDVSDNETQNIDDCDVTKKEEEDCDDSKRNEESSILSVDCVDLSEVDEDDSQLEKSKKDIQDLCVSDTSDVEEVIDLNETDEQNNSKTFSNKTVQRNSLSFNRSNSSTIKISKIIGWCKDTKDLPDVGDIMIFKIPFTNRHGNPDCTKFLAGKAERIQHRTKTIKFLILDGHSELHFVPSQYLNNYLENSMCDEKFVQIKFSELIQPRLLPKNKISFL